MSELERKIKQALQQGQGVYEAVALNFGVPGEYIWVNPKSGGASRRVRCGSIINNSQVTVFDGVEGVAFCQSAPQVVLRRQGEFLQVRPKPLIKPKYPIKILFSLVESGQRNFYIGGDRATPVQIFSLSESTALKSASVSNKGETIDDWVATIHWYTGDDATNAAIITPSATTNYNDSILQALEDRGHGFLASDPTFNRTIHRYYLYTPSTRWVLTSGSESGNSAYTIAAPGVGTATQTRSISTVSSSTLDRHEVAHFEGLSTTKGLALQQDGFLSALNGSGSTTYDLDYYYLEFNRLYENISENASSGSNGSIYLLPTVTKPTSFSYTTSYTGSHDLTSASHSDSVSLSENYYAGLLAGIELTSVLAVQHQQSFTGTISNGNFLPAYTNNPIESFSGVTDQVVYISKNPDGSTQETTISGYPIFDNPNQIGPTFFNLVSNTLYQTKQTGYNAFSSGELEIDAYALNPVSKTVETGKYFAIAQSGATPTTYSMSYYPVE